MLVELCVGNYETSNGLINGANGIFQDCTKVISKYLIWIQFQNFEIENKTRIKYFHVYEKFLGLIRIGHQLNIKLLKYK
jgi:hypothetical protein